MIRNCQSRRKYFLCKGNHHSSICDKDVLLRNDKREDNERIDRKEYSEKKSVGTETKINSAFASKNTILLQTAQLNVKSISRLSMIHEGVSCKVIFDSGSQRSYITRGAAKAVGATIHHKEKLRIGGFGGATTKEKLHDVVEVQLSKEGFDVAVKIQGIVVDKTCSPLQWNYINRYISLYPHLEGLPLGDEGDNGEMQEVSLLIGLDYYHNVVMGDIIRGKEGPVAVRSKFGYILSGSVKGAFKGSSKNFRTQVLNIENMTNDEIFSEIRKFWGLEAV